MNYAVYNGAMLAGCVAALMLKEDTTVETAATVVDDLIVLSNGVCVKNMSEEVKAGLIAMGCDIRVSGEFAHVVGNLEFAAKARSAAKKAAPKETKKRLTAEEKRAEKIGQETVKFLTTPQAAALVKRVWQNFVGAEDYALFPMFFKELDGLIAEYRIHANVDSMPDVEIADDEDEENDYDDKAIVGSVQTVTEDVTSVIETASSESA